MRCEERVVLNEGNDMHFCNVTKKGDVRNCHSKYHQIIYPNPNNKRNRPSSTLSFTVFVSIYLCLFE